MKRTGFVSHYDCSRHDPGWNFPDHQGRLPAVMRAVHRDLVVLIDRLLEVEGRHASEAELRLVHGEAYLDRLRTWAVEAARQGSAVDPRTGGRVSGASWAAARAAVGSTLRGVDLVLDGEVENAFCAVRPPGRYVTTEAPARFGLVNPVAVAARYLLTERGVAPLRVVEWGGPPGSATAEILHQEGEARVIGVHEGVGGSAVGEASGMRLLPPGARGREFLAALEGLLVDAFRRMAPSFILISADFDGLAGDPVGSLALAPRDYFDATVLLGKLAHEAGCTRVVSVLEGGYDGAALGLAVVQHLRALAGLEPVV
ncbi:MAG TPA: hypothetical protein VMN39_00450 [Longimicrobiaceae bacterium]|nr:hypothetical protein [Longimicrobiaceae bacterium]